MDEHNINHALQTALELAGDLKQADLARALGIRASSVSLWFSGRNKPDVENLSKVARVLNVNFEWLATGRGPMRYEEKRSGETVAPAFLQPDQTELLALFSRLAPARKRALLEFLKKFS